MTHDSESSAQRGTSTRQTRRTFLTRLAGLGMTVAALDTLLAACGGEQPATTPAASSAASTAASAAPSTAPAASAAASSAPATSAAASSRPATATGGSSTPGAGGQSSSASAAPIEKVTPVGQIIYASRMSELTTLHPFVARFSSALAASSHINEGLTKFAPNFGIQPGLATKWEVSSDQLTFTFTLRTGVKWHDGQPFTAKDVRFTLESAGATDSKSPAQPTLKNFVSAIDTPNDQTVIIKLSKAYSPLLAVLAEQLPILPAHLLDGKIYDEQFAAKPIGTGPYKVKERQTSFITLTANTDYWGQLPYTATIILRDAPEAAAQQAGLLAGELDVIGYVPTTMQGLKAQGFPVFRGPAGSVHSINVDLQNPILQDQKVRKALMLGLDRQRIQSVQYTDGILANTIVSPAYGQYHNDTLAPVNRDVKAAAALLDEAGWKVGANGIREKDGQPLKLNYQAWAEQSWQNIAAIAQASWKEIGVDIAIQTVELARLTDTLSSKYDLTTVGWNVTSDPVAGLSLLLQSTDRTLKEGGTRNVFRYKNAQVDSALADANATTDLQKRVALVRQIQQQVYNDLPMLPFAHPAYQMICKQSITLDETGAGNLSSIGIAFFMNRWKVKA